MEKEKKKGGCLKPFLILVVILFIIGAIGSLFGGNDEQESAPAENTSVTQQTNAPAAPTTEAAPETNEDVNVITSYEGQPLTDLMDKLNELGYSATYYADDVDFTDFIDDVKADYSVDSVEVDTENKTVSVDLVLTSNLELEAKEAALTETLEPSACWIAAENYGEELYPYGFELHYFLGKIAEEMQDDTSWFLKAECTVTNEYGAEVDGTCEAVVGGTTDSPEIISFTVY